MISKEKAALVVESALHAVADESGRLRESIMMAVALEPLITVLAGCGIDRELFLKGCAGVWDYCEAYDAKEGKKRS